jgi:hypothetical protein
MLAFLNIFFFVFHSALIIFNLFGWIWIKTRLANLIVILLTTFSWTILGIWYGFGFCPCTDWHWQVRMKLGYFDMPSSYIKFLIDSLTGLELNEALVKTLAVTLLALALVASVVTNVRDWKRKRK